MEVWSGHISQLDHGPNVNDIHLNSIHDGSLKIPTAAKLNFLAQVEVAEIPLMLIAGPSYRVSTTNVDTQLWLSCHILREPAMIQSNQSWFDVFTESYAGILVRVGLETELDRANFASELLIYGVCQDISGSRSMQVLAVPLSSSRLRNIASVPSPPRSPTDDQPLQLPDVNKGEATGSFALRKNIFDTANELRRQAAGRGGAGIQAAAAGHSQARLLVGHKKQKQQPAPDMQRLRLDSASVKSPSLASPALSHIKHPFRRSPSLQSSTRPHSRKDSRDLMHDSMTPDAVSTSQREVGISSMEQLNKETISRLVMAGMRLYGLQMRKKPESDDLFQQAATNQTESDMDYKQIYHQAYKASVFAFVSHLAC